MSNGEMDIKWMLAYIFMSMNPANFGDVNLNKELGGTKC